MLQSVDLVRLSPKVRHSFGKIDRWLSSPVPPPTVRSPSRPPLRLPAGPYPLHLYIPAIHPTALFPIFPFLSFRALWSRLPYPGCLPQSAQLYHLSLPASQHQPRSYQAALNQLKQLDVTQRLPFRQCRNTLPSSPLLSCAPKLALASTITHNARIALPALLSLLVWSKGNDASRV